MKFHIILGQRKCRYEGEYGPEALDIADEFVMSDNPEWFEKQLAKHKKNTDFEFVNTIIVSVPDKVIDEVLNPKPVVVEGKVEKS